MGAGFAWFVHQVDRPARASAAHADGIVALTGGAGTGRDRAAPAGRGPRRPRLLLSGIGGGAELPGAGASRRGRSPPLADAGDARTQATTTRGNALETAAWARANDIHSLIVVTAFYHMPRALAELRRALPEVELYPVPGRCRRSDLTAPRVPLRLIAEEYTQISLAATAGLTTVLPEHEPAPRAGGRAG